MKAVIISIGTELASGQCVDTNSCWLSAELTDWGIHVARHVTVGDDLEAIRQAIKDGLRDGQLILMTGGLGPTPDDVTREALAKALGLPLEENAEALRQIEEFFERLQRPFDDANRRQAQIPKGCEVIPNAHGTAPGIAYAKEGCRLFALPGVPAEMSAMFVAHVGPVLEKGAGDARALSARLLCFGMSEAKLGEMLGEFMRRGRNPLVGTTASEGIITARIQSFGKNKSQAKRMLDADVEKIRTRLGRVVFGADEDTLESVVGGLLAGIGLTVATAESCTGGLLAKRITDIPGSSRYFRQGFVTYDNEAKEDLLGVESELLASDGAVSLAVAEAMAAGCRRRTDADLAVAITGIAGPGGGKPPEKPVGLVYLALADANGVDGKCLLLGAHLSRAEIRDRSCKSALDLLRLRLIATAGE